MNPKKMTVNALLGQAAGDAYGVPFEFLSRKEVRRYRPGEMYGCDVSPLVWSRWGESIPAGAWSDDTSMTIASMASIAACGGVIDDSDQMQRFLDWWDRSEYCALSYPFGLGGTVGKAMDRYAAGVPAEKCGGRGKMDNGNGSLMRILPYALYCIFKGCSTAEMIPIVSRGSALTHAHEISCMCCCAWTLFLMRLAEGKTIQEAVQAVEEENWKTWFSAETCDELFWFSRITELTEPDIRESGYTADTLKTAFYSLLNSASYKEAICTAVSLGYDTDTAAAVTGMAAGMYYGIEAIPHGWLEKLKNKELLYETAEAFACSLAV